MKKSSFKTSTITAVSLIALSLSACTDNNDADSANEDDGMELNISLGGDENATSVSTSTNSDGTTSTSVSTAKGNGSSSSSSNKDGNFSLKADGIDINIDIPKEFLEGGEKSDDLYPGAVVTNVNVSSNSNGDNGKSSSNGVVNLQFTAPDKPKTVADWFVKKFKKDGGSAVRKGTNVAGVTNDGQDYTLTISPDGNGSKAVLAITGDSD